MRFSDVTVFIRVISLSVYLIPLPVLHNSCFSDLRAGSFISDLHGEAISNTITNIDL